MGLSKAQSHFSGLAIALLIASLASVSAAASMGASTAAAAADTQLLGINIQLQDACASAKPTLILISGVGGSQMSGVSKGSGGCPPLNTSSVVWMADHWVWDRAMRCWAQYMSLHFDEATGSFTNSSGTQLWPDYGKVFGDFPENSKQRLFYLFLLKHLVNHHNYSPGVDFFMIPFDWRTGIQGLEQTGGLQRIVDDISRAVKINCGKKAIVMSHSYGASVMATIFQKPEFAQWRQDTVSGWVPIGAAFGGSAATPWLITLSGDFFKLFPLASNLLKPSLTSTWKPTVIAKSVYKLAFGMPSWGWMLPREGVLGLNQTVIVTPTKNYTVLEQKQLMLDMGDVGGASMLEDSWRRSDAILQHGPVQGLDTYCLYSTGVVTPITLVFNESIPKHEPITRPKEIIWTSGDGVVDLNSLRLCRKLTTSDDRVVEVNGPLVDHASVLAHPAGLLALDNILYKLGVPKQNAFMRLVRRVTKRPGQ